jgi:hypothetical protein
VIHHRNQVPFDSVENAVQQVDDSFGALIDRLGAIDEDQWLEEGQFNAGDHLVMEAPCQQLAWMMPPGGSAPSRSAQHLSTADG